MDLASDMLFEHLAREHAGSVEAKRVRPHFVRALSRLPGSGEAGFDADRILNRLWYYPRLLRECRGQFDLFHIVDHSYAQLVSELPAERTVVTCHDLDAFRCLLAPGIDRRTRLFRAIARRILTGLCNAARVVCVSRAVRDEILAHKLLPRERMVVIPNGVHPACSPLPAPAADAAASRLIGDSGERALFILHVGSTIPRKRIDLLLRIFAALRPHFPSLRLLQAGGAFTPAQAKLVTQLELGGAVKVLPTVSRAGLAAIYRRAAVVLMPSDSEGFGLPVVEAMACGTPVIASDLPAMHEVGGTQAIYRPVGDIQAWSEATAALIRERDENPERWQARRLAGTKWASNFSWTEHTNRVVSLYQELLS